MSFEGFSLPEGAWLPPELVYLLPRLNGAELKIIVAVIYHNLQVGGSETVSITDMEHLTGLAHSTVIDTCHKLVDDYILVREPVGNSFVYRPVLKLDQLVRKSDYPSQVVRFSDSSDRKSDYKLSKLSLIGRESERKKNSLSSDSLNLTGGSISNNGGGPDEGPDFVALVKELRASGVYLKTAQALLAQHDHEKIKKHLSYYKYALTRHIAQGPGWLVLSIKEDWPAPLGFGEYRSANHGDQCTCEECSANRQRYTEWEQ